MSVSPRGLRNSIVHIVHRFNFSPISGGAVIGTGGVALITALGAIAAFGLHHMGVSPFDACRQLDWKVLTGGLILLGVTVYGGMVWTYLSTQKDVEKAAWLERRAQATSANPGEAVRAAEKKLLDGAPLLWLMHNNNTNNRD